MCLDSALDLWPPGHFALEFFASQIGRSKWSVQPWVFLRYVEYLEMDNSLISNFFSSLYFLFLRGTLIIPL